MDLQRISTTLSGATKALHHSVTSKMRRKASKMVTHPTPWGLIWFYSSLRSAHTSESPKRLTANIFKCSNGAESSCTALYLYIAERQNMYCNLKKLRYSHLPEYNTTYSDFNFIPCFASYYTFCRQLSLFLRHKRNLLITSTFAPHSPTLVAEMSSFLWWLVN